MNCKDSRASHVPAEEYTTAVKIETGGESNQISDEAEVVFEGNGFERDGFELHIGVFEGFQ